MTIRQEKIFGTILSCVVSEKSNMVSEKNGSIVLKVLKHATKREIKLAVENIFETEVVSVNTLISKGKTKRFRSTLGKRKDYKKAYVSLKKGQDLSVFNGVEQ